MAFNPGETTTVSVSTNIETPAYTEVGQVESIGNAFDWSNEAVDTPDLSRTSKTHRAGLQPDWGSLSFTVSYDSANASHTILEGLLAAPALALWKFTDSAATPKTWTGQGSLVKFSITGMDEDANIMADVEVKISGVMTKA